MKFTIKEENRIRLFFRISILLKGIVSLFEVIFGVLAFFIPTALVANWVLELAQGELVEDPGDFIATHLFSLAQQLSIAGGVFIGVYLLSRGLIKLALIVALLKNQLWAYPSSLIVLALFMLYQVYQIAMTHSLFIVALTILDVVVMWFIWQEYQVVKHELEKGSSARH